MPKKMIKNEKKKSNFSLLKYFRAKLYGTSDLSSYLNDPELQEKIDTSIKNNNHES